MACGTYASDKALALRFYEVYKVQKVRKAKVQTFEFCHRPAPLRGGRYREGIKAVRSPRKWG